MVPVGSGTLWVRPAAYPNRAMNETVVIDMKAIERLHEWGGKRLVAQMIDLFLQQAPQRLEGLRQGLANGDVETVERSAHSLKSTAGNLGAMALSDLAAKAEAAAGKRDLGAVRGLFAEIEAEYTRAQDALSVMEGATP